MKKILIMCLIALGMMFTSCTTTKSYMSINSYVNKVNSLKDYYAENGFYLNGTASNVDNSLIFNGTLFINNSATPIFKNNFLIKDTYKFKNDNDDYVNFTLGYKIGEFEAYKQGGKINDTKIEYEIIHSEVCACETNDYKQYEKLCRNEFLIDFNNVSKTDKIIVPNSGNILAIGITSTLAVVLVWYGVSKL